MSDTRTAILNVALDIYLREGLDALSMRKIAQRVGITATAIYRHFESKDALLAGLMHEAYGTFYRYLSGQAIAPQLQGAVCEDGLEAIGQGYFQFAIDHPMYYELLFMTPLKSLYENDYPEVAELAHRTFNHLVEAVQQLMDSGFMRPADAQQVATSIWAISHGVMSLYLKKQIPHNEAELREQFNSTMHQYFTGLAQDGCGS